MPRFDLTTIGEGSLRLSVPEGQSLERATNLNLAIAGSEANVAGALSSLGHKTAWFSKLPKTSLGRRVLNEYRTAGIETSEVIFVEDERLATLFVEYAVKPRPINVIFDRKQSAFSKISQEDINWDYLLDTRILHLTGITAALSEGLQNILADLVVKAKERNVLLSFDVNYREKLWSKEQAARVLVPLVQEAELLFCSQADAEKVFDCPGSPKDKLLQLLKKTQAKFIIMSCANDGVLAWDGQTTLSVPARDVRIIDRIGAGDALAAGVIHSHLNTAFSTQREFEKALHYGTTMAALAMSQFGEMVLCSEEQLEQFVQGESYDIVR